MSVGVRELKAKLSDYLGRAAGGETVVVTDRGRPVARLVPYDSASALERGVGEGWVEPARRHGLESCERFRSVSTVAATLDEDRG